MYKIQKKTILLETLRELLQLKKLNCEIILNVLEANVSSEGILKSFFIERNYKVTSYDNSANLII